MDIKQILEEGGKVEFPYKEKEKQWMGVAEIFSAYYKRPIVVVEIPTAEIQGRKEFDATQTDEAIALFKRLVFRKENLAVPSQ